MKKFTARSVLQSVAIPPDVKKWLLARMVKSRRSLSGEVVEILYQAKDKEKAR